MNDDNTPEQPEAPGQAAQEQIPSDEPQPTTAGGAEIAPETAPAAPPPAAQQGALGDAPKQPASAQPTQQYPPAQQQAPQQFPPAQPPVPGYPPVQPGVPGYPVQTAPDAAAYPHPQPPVGAAPQPPAGAPTAAYPPQPGSQSTAPYTQPTAAYAQGQYGEQPGAQGPYGTGNPGGPGFPGGAMGPGGPVPPRKGLSATVWWIIGGGALLVAILLISGIVLAVNLINGAARPSIPEPEPYPYETSDDDTTYPDDTSELADLPADITFEAGAGLPSSLFPGFSTTLIGDPDWTGDPNDTDLFDGSNTFTHNESGCVLFTYQTYATDIVFDPADDYTNSVEVIKSFYGTEEIGDPGYYNVSANMGASQVQFASVFANLQSGGGQLMTARGFGASNIALITTFTCADAAQTTSLFESLALPTMDVMFLP